MLQALRYTVGAPFLLARKLVADPIIWIDELLASGKPSRRPIKIEMHIGEFLDTSARKTRVEKEIIERLSSSRVGAQVRSQLLMYGRTEIVLVLRDAGEHPDMKLKMRLITRMIKNVYASPIGIRADVHAQGHAGSKKDPAVVVTLGMENYPHTLAAIS